MELTFDQTQAASIQKLTADRANLCEILATATQESAKKADALQRLPVLEKEKEELETKIETLFSDTSRPAEKIGEEVNVIQNALRVVQRRIETVATEAKKAESAWCRAAGRAHISAKGVIEQWFGVVGRARYSALMKLVQSWEPTSPHAPTMIQGLSGDSKHFAESVGHIQTLSYLGTVDGAQVPAEAPMVFDIATRTLEITSDLHEASDSTGEKPAETSTPQRRKLIPDRPVAAA